MGTLYGISTGPGDPELMTCKAVRILQQCSTVAAPRKPGTESLALRIASGTADLRDKQVMLLDFPMTRDPAALEAALQHAADRLCEALGSADTAFLCLGDISLYATSLPCLLNIFPKMEFEVSISSLINPIFEETFFI